MPAGDMDPVYSIGVSNRFGTIGIDMDDPYELIREAQVNPSKEKEPKTKGKKDLKPVKQTEKKSVKIETPAENESSEKRSDRPKSDRPRGGRGGRGGRGRGGDRGRGRGGSRGGFSPNSGNSQDGFGYNNNNNEGFGSGFNKNKSPVAEGGESFGSGFNSGFGGDNEERRGGRSGFRGGRGRGGRGRGRGGNREFDRRSGSDKSSVKAVDKRDGSGAFNWGTPQDEINAASEEHSGGFGTPKEAEDVPNENNEQVQETEEAQVEEVKDEGPQEITFEEYKKQLEGSRAKPEYNIRKVDDVRKGMKQLKKPTEEESVANNSFFFPKKNVSETYKSSGRVIEKIDVNIRYGTGENRHMDGTRRGGRGGRGRRNGPGGKRDESSNAKDAEIALGNDEEFPSL